MTHSEFVQLFFLFVPALLAILAFARGFPPDKRHGAKQRSKGKDTRGPGDGQS